MGHWAAWAGVSWRTKLRVQCVWSSMSDVDWGWVQTEHNKTSLGSPAFSVSVLHRNGSGRSCDVTWGGRTAPGFAGVWKGANMGVREWQVTIISTAAGVSGGF